MASLLVGGWLGRLGPAGPGRGQTADPRPAPVALAGESCPPPAPTPTSTSTSTPANQPGPVNTSALPVSARGDHPDPDPNREVSAESAPWLRGSLPAGWRVEVLPGISVKEGPVRCGEDQVAVVTPLYRLVPAEENGSRELFVLEPGYRPGDPDPEAGTLDRVIQGQLDRAGPEQSRLRSILGDLRWLERAQRERGF